MREDTPDADLAQDLLADLTRANNSLVKQANDALEQVLQITRENRCLQREIQLLQDLFHKRDLYETGLRRAVVAAVAALDTIASGQTPVVLDKTGRKCESSGPWDDDLAQMQKIASDAAARGLYARWAWAVTRCARLLCNFY